MSEALSVPDPSRLPGMSRRRVLLAERMVFEGMSLSQAAAAVQLTPRGARYAARHPQWLNYYRELCMTLRESARARAIHRLQELMEQDDNRMAAIRAAQHFDPPERPGNFFNLNVGVNVAPGYTVMPSSPRDELSALLRAAGSTRTVFDLEPEPLLDHEPGDAA